jgi:hypothetical protein
MFPWETYVLNIFTIVIISCSFLCKLVTYHWRGFKNIYNFVDGSISIKTHMQNLWSHKVWNTFIFWRTWFLPGEHGLNYSLEQMTGPKEKWARVVPGSNHVPLKKNVLSCPESTHVPWEQMCSKVCVIIIFCRWVLIEVFSITKLYFFLKPFQK